MGMETIAAASVFLAMVASGSAAARSLSAPPTPEQGKTLVVKTEVLVRKGLPRRNLEAACTKCKGSCRVTCIYCSGRGRTNHPELVMLPKGEWPKWCWCCRGRGEMFCQACDGTGERRGPMGFRLLLDD
eukprot:jgi/Mesvir1/21904/Mv01967-RA.1